MKKLSILLLLFGALPACGSANKNDFCSNLDSKFVYKYKNKKWILDPEKNHLAIDPKLNKRNEVTAVIEIPAGCNDKWEVNPMSGKMSLDKKNGKFRFINYISYPWNYGMIPGTKSGDGDPLDIIILGPSIPRGKTLRVRIIGMIQAVDSGESDEKVIAVSVGTGAHHIFKSVSRLKDLPTGAIDIIKTWLLNYKGKTGVMTIKGFVDEKKTYDYIKKVSQSQK